VGAPLPVFRKDRSFRGNQIALAGTPYRKGLGLAANTVIVYELGERYRTFAATLGIDADAAGASGPRPSIFLTVLVDGHCRFSSGAMYRDTPPRTLDVDLRGARTLVLRMSGNWDDNGDVTNDMASLADARLLGKAT
jgi:hypothetical protein